MNHVIPRIIQRYAFSALRLLGPKRYPAIQIYFKQHIIEIRP